MKPDNDFFHDEETSLLQYQSLLVDPITKLPTLTGVMKSIRNLVMEGKVGVYAINVDGNTNLESNIGWISFDSLIKFLGGVLIDMKLSFLGKDAVIAVDHPRGSGFFIFVPLAGKKSFQETLEVKINEHLCEALKNHGEFSFLCQSAKTGVATLTPDPKSRFERSFYYTVYRAKSDSINGDSRKDKKMKKGLMEIISTKKLSIKYQPIFKISSDNIFGYEALSRGPENSVFRSPETLFSYAIKFGLTGELDKACYISAFSGAGSVPRGRFIFLNMELETILDQDLLDENIPDALIRSGKNCNDFIIEVTERSIIENFPLLKERIGELKKLGFRIAVDDGGVGYASLGMISELAPDFIKLDMNLIRNIHKSIIKQNLIEAMVEFARKQKIMLVAEGIEKREEYEIVRDVGVDLAQGFLLGRPGYL